MDIYSVNVVEKKSSTKKVKQNLFISGPRKHPVSSAVVIWQNFVARFSVSDCGCIFDLRSDKVLSCSLLPLCLLGMMRGFPVRKRYGLALFVTMSIWLFQDRFLSMVTPRYSALLVSLSTCFYFYFYFLLPTINF